MHTLPRSNTVSMASADTGNPLYTAATQASPMTSTWFRMRTTPTTRRLRRCQPQQPHRPGPTSRCRKRTTRAPEAAEHAPRVQRRWILTKSYLLTFRQRNSCVPMGTTTQTLSRRLSTRTMLQGRKSLHHLLHNRSRTTRSRTQSPGSVIRASCKTISPINVLSSIMPFCLPTLHTSRRTSTACLFGFRST